jgi:hypothetical protein
MSNPNDHVPAYPFPHFARPDGDIEWGFPRLTKREYVAIQLAAGMLADESADPGSTYPPNGLAHRAVEFADALLAELAKPREGK